MLDGDDCRGTENLTTRDHGRGVVKRNPPYGVCLVSMGFAGPVSADGKVEVLRRVGAADHRLERQQIAHRPRPPARFLFGLPRRGGRAVFMVARVATGDLPHPLADDEAMSADQKYSITRLIEHQGHDATPHAEHVLRELGPVRKLDVRLADPNMRRIVDWPFGVDDPGPVGASIVRHVNGRYRRAAARSRAIHSISDFLHNPGRDRRHPVEPLRPG